MKRGRGRPPRQEPPEGKKQSMKELTKDHEKFMATRPFSEAVAKNTNENAEEDFENLLTKATHPKA